MPPPKRMIESTSELKPRGMALSILGRVRKGSYATPLLNAYLKQVPFRRDRAFITDLLYGTLRHFIYLNTCLKPRLRAPKRIPKIVLNGLIMGTYEIIVRGTPRHAAVYEWVATIKDLTPSLTGLANAVLRAVVTPKTLTLENAWSLPTWLAQSLMRALGRDAAERAAVGMLRPEPLWLSTVGSEAVTSMRMAGCDVTDGPFSNTVAVRSPHPLATLDAYRDGLVQPQNPSSQYPVHLLNIEHGERVLDLASGNGIKAANLAALGANVVSVDKSSFKLTRAKKNLQRMGFKAEQRVMDLTRPEGLSPAKKVLLDAPCSGTGTLRGNPEIKLRLSPEDISSLVELQSLLLTTAGALTLPGGTLVYSVCALTPEEGLGVVSTFLAKESDFFVEKALPPKGFPHVMTPNGVYLLPENGLDGFFVAKLRRQSK
jgi:16S rRNA (cytosine967-C5)-methyltransferase